MAARSGLFVLLLSVTILSVTEARYVRKGHASSELFITSSIYLNGPILGEVIGPYPEGQHLTLTCSTETSAGVLLSWWEGNTQHGAVRKQGEGLTSISLTIGSLRPGDSGRRFTCREKGSEIAKTIELKVQKQERNNGDEDLEILMDGQRLEDEETIRGKWGDGLSLNCVTQGYSPSAASWWEGDVELMTVVSKSPYATSSVLSLPPLTFADSGRAFNCRTNNGRLLKTVNVNVDVAEDHMDILVDGKAIEDGETVEQIAGGDLTINCVVQGYSPSAGSWWDGETRLKAEVIQSPYATSSVLSLPPLTVADSSRSFTCRTNNGRLLKTVNVNVDVAKGRQMAEGMNRYLYIYLALTIILLCLTIAALILVKLSRQPRKSAGKVTTKKHGTANRIVGSLGGKGSGKEDTRVLLVAEVAPVQEDQATDTSRSLITMPVIR